jgi:hypothetical protein
VPGGPGRLPKLRWMRNADAPPRVCHLSTPGARVLGLRDQRRGRGGCERRSVNGQASLMSVAGGLWYQEVIKKVMAPAGVIGR